MGLRILVLRPILFRRDHRPFYEHPAGPRSNTCQFGLHPPLGNIHLTPHGCAGTLPLTLPGRSCGFLQATL